MPPGFVQPGYDQMNPSGAYFQPTGINSGVYLDQSRRTHSSSSSRSNSKSSSRSSSGSPSRRVEKEKRREMRRQRRQQRTQHMKDTLARHSHHTDRNSNNVFLPPQPNGYVDPRSSMGYSNGYNWYGYRV